MTNPAQAAARAHKARLDAQRPNKLTRPANTPATVAALDATPTGPPPTAANTHQPLPPGLDTKLCATCYKHGYKTEATLVTVTGHAACANHADTITANRRP